jgi:hypothetical protein
MSQLEKKIVEVAGVIESLYNKAEMDEAFRTPVKNFLKTQEAFMLAQGVSEADTNLILAGSLPKAKASRLYAIPFANGVLYHAFLQSLPEDVRKVWKELIWTEEMDRKTIEQKTGVKVYSIENHVWRNGHIEQRIHFISKFGIMNHRGGYSAYSSRGELSLSIPEPLRKIVGPYHPKPPEAELTPVETLPATTHRFVDNERDILMELPRLLAYKEQGQIAVTGKGRAVHTTLSKMQRSLSLREFYPESEERKIRLLRTQLLAGLLVNPKVKKIAAPDLPSYLLNLFQKTYATQTHSAAFLLTDLKGLGHLDDGYFQAAEPQVFKLLTTLHAEAWYSFDNIRLHLKYNLETIKPVSAWTAANKLYYEYKTNQDDNWENKYYIEPGLYYDAVELPFLMGSFFLFAAFGLCELAYDETELEGLGQSVYSSWEGLRYVRLTPLGAYVCGQTTSYDTSNLAAPTRILLSPETLLIAIEEADVSANTILEPYTERVGATRFRTDSKIFLKNIRSRSELESKIALFKQVIGAELPPNWQSFFQELSQKIDPFQSAEKGMQIFKIPPDNKSLIQLIAQDPVLKNAVIKAEGFHILVRKANFPVFKSRLEEFGYLMT